MPGKNIYYSESTKPFAQELRRNMTKQERHLWYDFLKDYPVQFRRQKQISSFIADFYCAAAKLVIELDGSQHYDEDAVEYDRERSAVLEGHDLKVLRYSNDDVDRRFSSVCDQIDMVVKERTQR